MKPYLLAMASLFAAWAGMAGLCFGSPTQRHRLGLPEQDSRRRRCCVAGSIALLSLSLFAAAGADAVSFGIVLWVCQAGMAGLVLVCVLPYSPAWVTRTARVAVLLAPALATIAYRI